MKKTNDIIVLLPTYKEAENLTTLIPAIHKELTKQKHLILIVNDASGDGTEALIQKMSRKYPVALRERKEKAGLGAATIDGFRQALKKKPKTIIVMDADHSHPPSAIKELLKKSKDYDVVIGSRYTRGGGVDNWIWYRRLLSKAANAYARAVLGLNPQDVTGSYRAYNTKKLSTIALDKIQSNGYTFQEEILYALKRTGATMTEVPIIFYERREGQSKMPKTEILTGAIQLLKIIGRRY